MTGPRVSAPAGCADEARTLLDFHLNGSLTAEQDAAVRAHLLSCPSCTAELDELSSLALAIGTHGAEAGSAVARPWARRLAAAAALVVAVSAGVYWTQRWMSRSGVVDVHLDLGAGSLRDGSGPPVVVLTPASRTLVVSFFPPVRPGARFEATVVDAEDRTILPAAPIEGLDALGRATLRIPAGDLRLSGACRIVLDVRPPGEASRTFTYSFDVRHSATP